MGVQACRTSVAAALASLADASGMPLATCTTPAHSDERAQLIRLLDTLHVRTNQRGRTRIRLKVLGADKADNAKDLLHRTGRIRPQLPKRVWKSRKPRGRTINKDVPHSQAERRLAYFRRKYRSVWSPAGNVRPMASMRFSPLA